MGLDFAGTSHQVLKMEQTALGLDWTHPEGRGVSLVQVKRDSCRDTMRKEQDLKTTRDRLLVAIRAPLHRNREPAGCD